jgi:hypothetical protein
MNRKALNSLFDDAIDELEITYDVYFEIERYRRRSVHIADRLLSKGTRQGKVLVLGSNEKPFAMMLDKLGFQAEGFSLHQKLEYDNKNEGATMSSVLREIRDLQSEYDIIICDDVLQRLVSPSDTLKMLRDHLRPGGVLMVTTPNMARGTARLRLLTGKNICQPVACDESPEDEDKQIMPYREYTLRELEMLVKDAGLELTESEFIIGMNVNANIWPPMPVKEYFFQKLFLAVQKIAPPLRNYLYAAGRRLSAKVEKST